MGDAVKLRDPHLIRDLLQTCVSRVSAADAVSRGHDGADAVPLNGAVHLPALVLTWIRHLLTTQTTQTTLLNTLTQFSAILHPRSIGLSFKIKTPQNVISTYSVQSELQNKSYKKTPSINYTV